MNVGGSIDDVFQFAIGGVVVGMSVRSVRRVEC
jgi:hypothetical protein